MDNFKLLEQADLCPVCEQRPIPTFEPGHENPMVFLRCPNGHPYVACGDSLLMAINHWNKYIQFRIQQDTARMMHLPVPKDASFCGTCQANTRTLIQFDLVGPHDWRTGYVVIRKECLDCNLVKSQREVA